MRVPDLDWPADLYRDEAPAPRRAPKAVPQPPATSGPQLPLWFRLSMSWMRSPLPTFAGQAST
jgi:hypothetical protein